MQLIVALYTRATPAEDFHFKASLVTTETRSFIQTRDLLLDYWGTGFANLDRIVPAKTLSELPDLLENLNVD